MTDANRSATETVFKALAPVIEPILKSARTQSALNVQRWDQTTRAIEDAGYVVCPADLPSPVSGVAAHIEDLRLIVINRAEPEVRQRFTVVHELAHYELHLAGASVATTANLPSEMIEAQANLFAAWWAFQTTKGEEREETFRRNPEARCLGPVTLLIAAGLGIAVVLDLIVALRNGQPVGAA